MSTKITKNILFVGYTDTTLAPLIAAISKKQTTQNSPNNDSPFLFRFFSAGSHAGLNSRPIEHRIGKIAADNDLDLSEHTSNQLHVDDCLAADVVIAMKEDCFWFVREICPENSDFSLRMLMEFSDQLGLREMPDPLLGEIEFGEVFGMLESLSRKVVDKLSIKLA